MTEAPSSLRTELLVLLSVLFLSVPLFAGRAELRLALHADEVEVLLASTSLWGDGDLTLGPADQTRLGRFRLESLGALPQGRPIRLEQPVYSAAAGPLALLLGDAGLLLLNAAVLVALLWCCADPSSGDAVRFWWTLTYFLVCAYPVLVFRLDEAVLLGGLLFAVLAPWGERRPASSGLLAGLALPGHLWLLPVVAVLAVQRPRRFACCAAAGAAALYGLLAAAPAHEAGPASAAARSLPASAALPALAEPPPELLASAAGRQVAFHAEPLEAPAAVAHSWPVRLLLGRVQGLAPYFLPWLVGFCGWLGRERRTPRRAAGLALLAALPLASLWPPASPATGPAQPAIAVLLPAFFLFSQPLAQLSHLALVWLGSSVFTAVLFLNPLHAAGHPADPLTLGPHRLLPLELDRLDPRVVPAFHVPGPAPVRVLLPGRDAWAGPGSAVLVRGKRWGHVVLDGPEAAPLPELLVRAPVDLELELRCADLRARVPLAAGQPARLALPSRCRVPAGPAREGVELLLRPSSGLVPRLELDRGDGVDYVGVELWPLPG